MSQNSVLCDVFWSLLLRDQHEMLKTIDVKKSAASKMVIWIIYVAIQQGCDLSSLLPRCKKCTRGFYSDKNSVRLYTIALLCLAVPQLGSLSLGFAVCSRNRTELRIC